MTLQLLLFVLLVQCSAVLSQTGDPGLLDTESSASGSGSGSGSGDGSGDECFAPQYSPSPQFTLEGVAITEIRCHLACAERVSVCTQAPDEVYHPVAIIIIITISIAPCA